MATQKDIDAILEKYDARLMKGSIVGKQYTVVALEELSNSSWGILVVDVVIGDKTMRKGVYKDMATLHLLSE